ncbi:hypothetical protein PN442_06095, partial [Dolichospermum circinale CS-547]|nr:hypothetical protein [Dolichospermum circinale CS-547]
SQESGVRSQESGVRSQESGVRRKEERRKKKEERRKFFYSLFPVPCSLTTRLNLILSCMAFTSSL